MATEREAHGRYRQAIAAVITAFTGVSDLYEPPPKPAIELQTDREIVEKGVERLLVVRERGFDA